MFEFKAKVAKTSTIYWTKIKLNPTPQWKEKWPKKPQKNENEIKSEKNGIFHREKKFEYKKSVFFFM